jgi:hypothetical protein
VVIVTYRFAYLDEILLRRFYELSLHLPVLNLVNHSDWRIPVLMVAEFLQLGFLIVNYFGTSILPIGSAG